MTTLIGYRWKGSNVRSRVVLIARQACAYVRPFLVEGRTTIFTSFFRFRNIFDDIHVSFLYRNPVPFMSTILRRRPRSAMSDPKLRWPWRRGPPLTIPNREVKTVCADGTAIPSGRVGSRLFRKPLTVM